MLRYVFIIPDINTPKDKTKDKHIAKDTIAKLYCQKVLNLFVSELSRSVNDAKLKLRYDYLQETNILCFKKKALSYNQLKSFILKSFKVKLYISVAGKSKGCIYIDDFTMIPNSNMSLNHFLRFVEYGNLDVKPYNWIRHSLHKLIDKEEIII